MKWFNENYGTFLCACGLTFTIFLAIVTLHDIKVNDRVQFNEWGRGMAYMTDQINKYIVDSSERINLILYNTPVDELQPIEYMINPNKLPIAPGTHNPNKIPASTL